MSVLRDTYVGFNIFITCCLFTALVNEPFFHVYLSYALVLYACLKKVVLLPFRIFSKLLKKNFEEQFQEEVISAASKVWVVLDGDDIRKNLPPTPVEKTEEELKKEKEEKKAAKKSKKSKDQDKEEVKEEVKKDK